MVNPKYSHGAVNQIVSPWRLYFYSLDSSSVLLTFPIGKVESDKSSKADRGAGRKAMNAYLESNLVYITLFELGGRERLVYKP